MIEVHSNWFNSMIQLDVTSLGAYLKNVMTNVKRTALLMTPSNTTIIVTSSMLSLDAVIGVSSAEKSNTMNTCNTNWE